MVGNVGVHKLYFGEAAKATASRAAAATYRPPMISAMSNLIDVAMSATALPAARHLACAKALASRFNRDVANVDTKLVATTHFKGCFLGKAHQPFKGLFCSKSK